MAFARYFEKNLQAASVLVKGADDAQFRALLLSEVVGVAFDGSAAKASEGQDTLDLLVRIVARLYPNLALCGMDKEANQYVPKLRSVARAVNPDIALEHGLKDATRVLVVGQSALPKVLKHKTVLYVGSRNWMGELSQRKPVGSLHTGNPFGAGVAACIACANLFRAVFENQVGAGQVDGDVHFSVWDLSGRKASETNDGVLGGSDIGEVHVAGVGAIGNGVIWALSRAAWTGTVHLIDAEKVDATNLQRYVLTSSADEGKSKVQLAKKLVAASKRSNLTVIPHETTWESYVASATGRSFETVISALDSSSARIRLQSSLPKRVVNGWTQGGEAGVSRHRFFDAYACLACLYWPKTQRLSQDQLILQGLGIAEDPEFLREVRRRLQLGVACDRTFLEAVSVRANVAIERLLPFEGQSVQSLYQGVVCSGKLLDFRGSDAVEVVDVPMPFQSALAGILLAAELVPGRPALPTITQIDLLRRMPDEPSHFQKKAGVGKCICEDEDFQRAYTDKYGRQEVD